MRLCSLCGRPIEPDERVEREIAGYPPARRRDEHGRTQGGTNAVSLTRYTGNEAHALCVSQRRVGVTAGQTELGL